MKIAMVSEHANPLASPGSVDAGGQNVHVAALAKALALRGHQVTVYTRRDSEEVAEKVSLSPGVDVVHVTAGPTKKLPKDELLQFMRDFATELQEYWQKDKPDIVHSHFWMSGVAALEAANKYKLPVVHTFHALGSVKQRFQGANDTSPRERRWLEPMVGREATAIIATCKDEVKELEDLGINKSKILIAPCGVDEQLFEPSGLTHSKSSTFRLLSIGRLVPRKGVDNIIRALPLVNEPVELEIIGAGDTINGKDPEMERLKNLATELNVSTRVHFHGQVAQEKIPYLIRSADAVVCTPWYEPFGIVPLESMACGTPVIVSSVGGLKSSVIDRITGLHVEPQNPVRLAAAISELASDVELCREMGSAGRERVQANYTWQKVAELSESIYELIILKSRAQHSRQRELVS